MQSNSVQISESLTAGLDLDMVIAEYDALEKVNCFISPVNLDKFLHLSYRHTESTFSIYLR